MKIEGEENIGEYETNINMTCLDTIILTNISFLVHGVWSNRKYPTFLGEFL